ncbi:MAG TPA: MBL fold metallo-hydrolase RNA specificity domain-containing protein [Candidatus Limnocylindria bacterium]|nr:MBL fold metallo-hydrolase RNA specificity domain-containing protein [Candidatus Limnocylindria bacterium]
MAVQIQFLGAVGTVTGSQFLVRIGQKKLLVDCGMFQGSPEEISRNRLPFAFDPDELDALLLTHAHLDHCGRIPALVKAGYRGPIYATAGTADLAEIVLRDSAKLQEEAAERWQRRHRERPVEEAVATESDEEAGVETEEPLPDRMRKARPEARAETREALYTIGDVEQTVRQFRSVDYESSVDIADGVRATFHDAGHILGSAIIELHLTDAADELTVIFSGDLGRGSTPILRDPTPISRADFVLVESTYGNREHAPQEESVNELVQAISEVADSRGVLLVPSFAIGRTQELVWMLDELLRQGRIPRMPLFLDSPMASRATDVYLRHPEDYDEETAALLRSGDSPLEYPGETYTNTVEQSKSIRQQKRPIMVVASSGMLTGGRIVHHLKDFLPDPNCTLLFIGYQGQGTLGRHIQSGGKTARLDGEEYEVRCRVRSISGFSAHADEHELAAWLSHFGAAGQRANGEPKQVFIVHGDPDAADAFAERVRSELRLRAYVPKYEETIALS